MAKNAPSHTEKQMRNLFEKRLCVVCNRTYTNATSLGQYQCFEHPLGIMECELMCCGLPTNCEDKYAFYSKLRIGNSKGCIRADHNHEHVPYSSNTSAEVKVSKKTLESLNLTVVPRDNAIKRFDDTTSVVFVRYHEGDFEKLSESTKQH